MYCPSAHIIAFSLFSIICTVARVGAPSGSPFAMFPAKVAALWGAFWVCAAWWVRLVPGGSLATSSHAVRSRAQARPGRYTGLAGGVAGVGAVGVGLPAGVAWGRWAGRLAIHAGIKAGQMRSGSRLGLYRVRSRRSKGRRSSPFTAQGRQRRDALNSSAALVTDKPGAGNTVSRRVRPGCGGVLQGGRCAGDRV